jgi:hypothetical protein
MEKRSRRRIRDLVALTAIQGLSENEIGCARISMMARSRKRSIQGPDTEAQDQPSPDHHIQLATHGRSIQIAWTVLVQGRSYEARLKPGPA